MVDYLRNIAKKSGDSDGAKENIWAKYDECFVTVVAELPTHLILLWFILFVD
jgi:hypothetical protein